MRERARLLGESSEDGMAAALCEAWRCPADGHEPYASHADMPQSPLRPLRKIAATAHKIRGQIGEARTCPFAPLYDAAHPTVARVIEGVAGLEDGLSERTAFPGGVTSVDLQALRVYRRGRAARMHSDDAFIERERAEQQAKPK